MKMRHLALALACSLITLTGCYQRHRDHYPPPPPVCDRDHPCDDHPLPPCDRDHPDPCDHSHDHDHDH